MTEPAWLTVTLAVLNVVQVVLLANISQRSQRRRREDSPQQQRPGDGE